MMELVFRSKIDFFIGLVYAGVIVVSAYSAFAAFAGRSSGSVAIGLVIALLGVGLPVWLVLSTRYILTDESLLVRSGPVRKTIPIAEIHSVEPSRDARSSPALSLSRLRIEHSGGAVLISPKDVKGFLVALEERRARFFCAPVT